MFVLLLSLSLWAILSLVSFSSGSSSTPFPVFRCHDTHYECSRQLASEYANMIDDIMMSRVKHFQWYDEWKSNHEAEFEESVQMTRTLFPWVYDELRGTADGSKIDFDTIYLFQMMWALDMLMPTKVDDMRKSSVRHKLRRQHSGRVVYPTDLTGSFRIAHCTDVHVLNSACHASSHNEDFLLDFQPNSILVDMSFTDGDTTRILSYVYPGLLPGNSQGFNEHGLTLSSQSVFPWEVNDVGIPMYVYLRAALSSRTISDALSVTSNLSNRLWGLVISFGMLDSKEQVVVECTASESGLRWIRKNETYVHANNFQILGDVDYWVDPSSIHRMERVKEMKVASSVSDIRSVLGDTKDPIYPIYRDRTTGPDAHVRTLATFIFDYDREKWMVWRMSNPKESDPVQVFSMRTFEQIV